jgi:hypothetical protein
MSDGNGQANYGSHGNEGAGPEKVHPLPYWRRVHQLKRIHHSWLFWVGMALVTAAITIYVMSDNLALLPRGQPPKSLPGQLGQ